MAVAYDQILPFTSCFQLVRTNPLLTGNLKLTISSDGNLWFNSIDANSELTKDNYKHYPVDPGKSHSSQVKNFFGDSPQGDVIFDLQLKVDVLHSSNKYEDQYDFSNYFSGAKYLASKYYTERFSFLAPLYLNQQIPEHFVILKIPGSTNYPIGKSKSLYPFDQQQYAFDMFDGASIVASFSMGPQSKIGRYLNKIYNDPALPVYPLKAQLQEDQQTLYNGVSLKTGTYASLGENQFQFYKDAQPIAGFEEYITLGFKRNLLLHPFIFNMEFLFDDPNATDYDINRYVGFYCNSIELQQLTMDLDRFLDRSVNHNTPSFRKTYNITDDVTLLQNNPDGIDLFVKEEKLTGLDKYDKTKMFFPYLLDKNDGLHIIKRDSVVNDNLEDRTAFKITTTSMDIGQLFGPDEIFLQDTAQSEKLQGQSYIELNFKANPIHLDRFRIYHIGGTQEDENGTFDDVVATIGWSEIPNTNDYYVYYDNQNHLGDTFMFNATGTIDQVVSTMAKCINSIRNKGFTAYAYNNRIFLKANTPGFYDDRFSIMLTLNAASYDNISVFDMTGAAALDQKQIFFRGGSEGYQLLLDYAHFDKVQANIDNLLVMTDQGWSPITAISKYASIINEENSLTALSRAEALTAFDSKMSIHVAKGQTPTVKYQLGQIRMQFYLRAGVLSFFEIKDFDFDRYSSTYANYPNVDLYKEFFVPPNRTLLDTDQKEYVVVGNGQISINETNFNPGDIITGLGDGLAYTVKSGDCFVVENPIYIAPNVAVLNTSTTSYTVVGTTGSIIINGNTYVPGDVLYQIGDGLAYTLTDQNSTCSVVPTAFAGTPANVTLTQPLYDANKELQGFPGFAALKSDANVIPTNTSSTFVFRDKYINGLITTEYDFDNENDTKNFATKSLIIPYITKWGLLDGLDVRDNAYRLNNNLAFGVNNFSPNHFTKNSDPNGFTHEWFYMESSFNYLNDKQSILDNMSYFDKPLNVSTTDKDNSILFNENGFNDYFIYTPTLDNVEIGPSQYRYSIIAKDDNGVYTTFFRGVKYVFREISPLGTTLPNGKPTFVDNTTRFDGYKFTVILKTIEEDFTGKDPIKYQFIEHDQYKWITLVVTIKVCSLDQITNAQLHLQANGNTPPAPGFDDIFGDYRITFNDTGVSNLDYAFFYYAQNKKYNEVLDSFSTTSLGNKLDFSRSGIVNLPTSFSISRSNLNYFIDLKDEVYVLGNDARGVTDDFYFYLKGQPGSFILKKVEQDSLPIITDIQMNKIFVSDVYNLELQGTGSSAATSYGIPSSSTEYWNLFNLYQFKGGKDYYRNLFKYVSFSYVRDIINAYANNIIYTTYDTFDQNLIESTNEFYVEVLDPEFIQKEQVVTSEPDLILDLALSQSSNIPKQVGYNLFANTLTSPYALNRYSGGYDAIFKDVAFYNSKTTIQDLELSHANVELNMDFVGTFNMANFNHIKVANTSILSLANDPKYQSVYPLVDEVAIGRAPYFLLSSNWEYGYHHQYLNKSEFKPASGTLRIGEDYSYVSKLVKLPNSIYLQDYEIEQVNINSLNGNYSNVELAYQEDKVTVNGIINLANVAVRYLSGTKLADNIKVTFVDVNGNPITNSEEFLGNVNIEEYIQSYISDNLLNLYQIDVVEVWMLNVKSVTSGANVAGNNPNTVQFVNLNDAQRASQGYTLNKSVQINKMGDFLLGFSINKPTNSSLSVSFNIKISLI